MTDAATTTTTADTTPAATTTTAAANQPWFSAVADADLRGKAELKGWKTPDDALKSYFNLESHIGAPAERLLKLPERPDDPAWKDVHKRLGFSAPETAAEYELEVPEGFGTDFASAMAEKAKELGIPKHMLKGLADHNNALVKAALDEQERAIERGVVEAQAALKAEWGGKFDETMTLAQRAETAMKADLGVGDEEMLAMMNASPRAYYKMLAGYGGTMREAPHISGEGAGNNALRPMSPDAAGARRAQLMADPDFRTRYLAGDANANAEMKHLLVILDAAKNGR